jgi:hypothetical protein
LGSRSGGKIFDFCFLAVYLHRNQLRDHPFTPPNSRNSNVSIQ